MPLDNGKVVVSWPLAEHILALNFNAPTIRLVFSMLHQLDLSGVCGPGDPEDSPVIWASCAELRERVGPKGSKGAREIRAAAEALEAAGMLEQFALFHNATNLQWQFAAWIREDMRNRFEGNWVLVDLMHLGRFSSAFKIFAYLNSQKLHKAKAPEFYIPYDPRKSEEANKRQVLSGLKSVSSVLGWVFYTGLLQKREAPEPMHFKVRILHPSAKWRFHSYMLFERPKAIWRIDPSEVRRFDRRTVRDARADLVRSDELEWDQQVAGEA